MRGWVIASVLTVTGLAVALVVAVADWSPSAAVDPARALLLGPLQSFVADRERLLPAFDQAELAVYLAAGVAGVLSGLAVWRLGPADLTPRLIVAAGLLWILSGVRRSADPALFTAGALLTHTTLPIMVQISLGYPTGRLRRRAERVAVGGAWALATVGVAAEWLFFDPRTAPAAHRSTARNLLLVRDLPELAHTVQLVVGSLTGAAAIVLLAVLIARWRRGRGPSRIESAAITAAAAALIALLFVCMLMAVGALLISPGDEWFLELRSPVMALVPLTVAVVLLRYHLAGAAIRSAMVEIGTAPLSTGFVEALRRALHDPGLAVWTYTGAGGYVDAAGVECELPRTRGVTVLESNGSPVGAVVHDESLASRPELLAAVRSATTLALDHAKLRNELSSQLEEVRRSRERIVAAGDVQRRRLERDLHDGTQQHLVAADIHLGRARRATGDAAAREMIDDAARELRHALDDLRDLARGVYPPTLTANGLAAALHALAERTPIPVEIDDATTHRPPPHVELAAYFTAAEAVANVCKHANAGLVEIHLRETEKTLTVEIHDDGTGGATPVPGGGLDGLADRAAALGGSFTVDSPPGRGTAVRAEFPLN